MCPVCNSDNSLFFVKHEVQSCLSMLFWWQNCFLTTNEAQRNVKRRIEQKSKWFFMYINYLCISYVLFADIFTRSFDEFISMKFLSAVFLPPYPFIPTYPFIDFGDLCQPPCLLFWPKFASLSVYSTLSFYLKLEITTFYSSIINIFKKKKKIPRRYKINNSFVYIELYKNALFIFQDVDFPQKCSYCTVPIIVQVIETVSII